MTPKTFARVYLLTFLLAWFALSLCGCKSSRFTGGTTATESRGIVLTYQTPSGTATVRDNRDYAATTQPSVTATGHDATLTSDAKGGFRFQTEEVRSSPTAWGLIAILIVAGVFCYAVGNWPGVILCVAGITLAFVYPAALVWIALAAVAWVLWSHRAAIVQLVRGTQNAIDILPAGDAKTLRTELEKAQAPNVKAVVASVKNK